MKKLQNERHIRKEIQLEFTKARDDEIRREQERQKTEQESIANREEMAERVRQLQLQRMMMMNPDNDVRRTGALLSVYDQLNYDQKKKTGHSLMSSLSQPALQPVLPAQHQQQRFQQKQHMYNVMHESMHLGTQQQPNFVQYAHRSQVCHAPHMHNLMPPAPPVHGPVVAPPAGYIQHQQSGLEEGAPGEPQQPQMQPGLPQQPGHIPQLQARLPQYADG